jgi:PAS domain S-box-containing protein/putative nucleotidyltransferase with HDIG domain
MDFLKLLFVEDLQTDYELAQWHLRKDELAFDSICVDTQPAFLNALEQYKPDLIISDYSMPEFNGMQALNLTLANRPDIPFIVLTGSINEETAVLCMKAGASDYVLKEKMHRLPFSVRETMKRTQDRKEKILAEKRLRESEAKFREIFESANVGKTITTPDEITAVNKAFADMLGYSQQELMKLSWQEITPLEDINWINTIVSSLLTGELDAVRYDKRYIHKNGSYVWVDISVKVHRDPDGKPLYFISTIIDISQRKLTEEKLKASEENYRLLVENQSDMIVKIDPKGHFLYVSPSYCRKFGKKESDLIGKKFAPLVHEDDLDETLKAMETLSHPPYTCYVEQRALTKDGWKWLSWTDTAIMNDRGEITEIIGSGTDITERRKAEKALKDSIELMELFIQNSPIYTFIKEVNPSQSKVLMASDNYFEMVGFSNAEMINKTMEDLFPLEFAKKITADDWSVITEGKVLKLDEEFNDRYYTSIKFPIIQGEKTLLAGYTIDITEKKLADDARHQSEIRYRSLFEDSPVSIFEEDFSAAKRYIDTLRKKGVSDFLEYFTNKPEELAACVESVIVTDVNQASLKLFGAETKEQLKTQLNKMVPQEDPLLLLEEFVNIANGLPQFELETVNKTLDGKDLVLSVRWAVAPGYTDDLSKVIISVIDITERNLAAEQQRIRLAQMEAMDNITSTLRMARSVGEALPIVLTESLAFLGLSVGTVWLYEKNSKNLKIATAIGWQGEIENAVLLPGEGIAGKVFVSGNPIVSSNFMEEDSVYPEAMEQIPEGYGGACIPIHSLDETLGVIFVASLPPREIQPEETKFLEALARIAGITLQRMTLHEETVSHLQQLQAQRMIDQTIASIFDLRLALDIICTQVRNHLNADAAGVLLYSPNQLELKHGAGNGFRSSGYQRSRVRLGVGHAGKAALERQTIFIKDINDSDPPFSRKSLINEDQFITFIATPLIAKGEIKGVLEVYFRSEYEFQPTQLEFLESLGLQTAIAIDNLQLFEDLQHSNLELVQAYDATIEGWSRALDLRDKETEDHTLRVTDMTVLLARAMGVSEEEMVHMRRGALLHDIGKMGIPDDILKKPGPLTEEEWEIMRMHPRFSYEMISPIEYLRPALDIPYCHHEKWDGSGYPRGLKADQIPLAGRIFAIIDVWDALISDRPYRKAWPEEKVLTYLKEQSGIHFDPEVVEVFLLVLKEYANS